MTLEQYRLLHHWTVYIAPLLCISPSSQTNSFQMYLTPMALCDPNSPLRHAVLSIAASHLATSDSHLESGQNLALAAQGHRLAAIASLRKRLGEDPSTTANNDILLASILLLEMSKQFDNNGQNQEGDVNHLLGATELIRTRGGLRYLTSPCGRFLLTQILYYDLLSAVAKGSEPLICHSGLNETETVPLLLDLESSRGYHATILQAVARISELKKMKDAGCAPATLMVLGQKVKSDLESMDIHGLPSDRARTTEAHRSAAFIYLHRVVYDIGAPHALTLYHVRRCIDSLAAVPISSPLVSAHVWPLFTAGCEATEPRDREFVKQRLMNMHAMRRIQSIRKVWELMEHVWLSKDFTHCVEGAEQMSRLGCIEVVKEMGEMLHLA
ncbi:fungal specific transcription factor domain-containing protein [Aspergillus mulundensis]|uniref:Putative Maltose o-acetyltransferase n=1 Tax=Aspergillus mulundensis TaxID=1810919 RepID=A0A3D8SU83_9EURO|nr:putative Maltose o-acetyltransferase [Aspergillus mulundensis]RDW89814.1 putative Maltose o-acetyltransferase [Aspergillus mulundensis]